MKITSTRIIAPRGRLTRTALAGMLLSASCGAPGALRLYAHSDGASTVASDLHSWAIIAAGSGRAELRIAGAELPAYSHAWEGARVLAGRHKPEERWSIPAGETIPPEVFAILQALFSPAELAEALEGLAGAPPAP